jgi:hypothetical protein
MRHTMPGRALVASQLWRAVIARISQPRPMQVRSAPLRRCSRQFHRGRRLSARPRHASRRGRQWRTAACMPAAPRYGDWRNRELASPARCGSGQWMCACLWAKSVGLFERSRSAAACRLHPREDWHSRHGERGGRGIGRTKRWAHVKGHESQNK